MKKLSFFLIMSLIVACSAIKERLAIKECKFSLVGVEPYDFTFSKLKLDFEIKGDNPNKVDAVLDKLDYTFYVNQTALFSGSTGKGIKIPAGKSSKFTTTITLEYAKIGEALTEAIRLKKASYRIRATAYIKTPIAEINYPVDIGLK